MIKTFISVAGVAAVLLLACFTAYLVNRDMIQQHEIRLKHVEENYKGQKLTLTKVADNLAALKETFAELVGELKHFRKGNYYEKDTRSINDDDRSRFVVRNRSRM